MIWALAFFGVLYGWAAALAVRRFSDRARVRVTVDRIVAHLMELELFLDSPSVILRAQRDLARENLRLLRLVAPASLVPAAIFVLLYPQLDALFGYSPLPVGDRTVVSARVDEARLEAPAGFVIETPAVHIVRDREVSWRVRPVGQAAGELTVHVRGGRQISRRIVAGSGLIDGWRLPFNAPVIDIRYPRRDYFGLPWLLWFFPISLLAGFAGAIRWKR
ncbi:MAG TPA: hypothetical protein VN519_09160 [Bryobacteraceae bacterium]|nr:hypothetical protein [Bryobacteraceae bacterium]